MVMVAGSSQSSMNVTWQPRISPSRAATLASDFSGSRPTCPKIDLLPAALLAELERVFHRPQADVAVAHLGAGLGVHVAADQHGRAAGQLAQALHARNARQILFQAQTRRVRIGPQQFAAPGRHGFGGDCHDKISVFVIFSDCVSVGSETAKNSRWRPDSTRGGGMQERLPVGWLKCRMRRRAAKAGSMPQLRDFRKRAGCRFYISTQVALPLLHLPRLQPIGRRHHQHRLAVDLRPWPGLAAPRRS